MAFANECWLTTFEPSWNLMCFLGWFLNLNLTETCWTLLNLHGTESDVNLDDIEECDEYPPVRIDPAEQAFKDSDTAAELGKLIIVTGSDVLIAQKLFYF